MWGALNWKKEVVRFEQVLSRLLIVVSTFLSLDQYICQKGNVQFGGFEFGEFIAF